jgi:hypothetical protein
VKEALYLSFLLQSTAHVYRVLENLERTNENCCYAGAEPQAVLASRCRRAYARVYGTQAFSVADLRVLRLLLPDCADELFNHSTRAFFTRLRIVTKRQGCDLIGGKARMAVPLRIERRMRSTAGILRHSSCKYSYLNSRCNRGLTNHRGDFDQVTWVGYLVGIAMQFSIVDTITFSYLPHIKRQRTGTEVPTIITRRAFTYEHRPRPPLNLDFIYASPNLYRIDHA